MIIIPDFINQRTVTEILSANSAFTGVRRGEGTAWSDCPLSTVSNKFDWLADDVLRLIDIHYPYMPELAKDYIAYTTLSVGGFHTLHADSVKDENNTPNHTPHRLATAMLYLGTENVDFAGGSIDFPGLGTKIRPTAGTLVGFLCDWKHRHEVERVTQGVRHAIALWFKAAFQS